MNYHCALCGRLTLHPAVMIANHPVGPTCARRAGLIALSQKKSGVVFPISGKKTVNKVDSKTLDLFEVAA